MLAAPPHWPKQRRGRPWHVSCHRVRPEARKGRQLPSLLLGTLVMAMLLVSMYAGIGPNTDVAKGITGLLLAFLPSFLADIAVR